MNPLKLCILSREPRNYSTSRLRDASRERGHQVKVLSPLNISVGIRPGDPQLYYRNRKLSTYDAVIPRVGASITFYGTAIVRQFERMGVYTLNTSHAITVSRDKLRSLQVLSRHQIGIPETTFVRRRDEVLPAIERLGGAPVIIKLLEGTQGVGVILADTSKVAQAIVETLQGMKANVLIQKFVAESKGKDVRAFVIGGQVVAAMRRVAQEGEFRSNVHRGGRTEAVELSEEYTTAAVHAARILGLHVAGVDLLESDEGPKVLEVNSSPGLEGIETATGIDIAGKIIEHLEEQVRFPDVDLKNRLSLDKGYAISELDVSRGSDLAHKTLRELALKEQDILVLSIERVGLTLPNPAADTEILPGDRLLCYGKRPALRDLLPHKQTRKGKR